MVKVSISCGMSIEEHHELKYDTFEECKVGLLKRFGNIKGSNKGEKDRHKVKRIIKESSSFEEIQQSTTRTAWRIQFQSNRHMPGDD